MPFPTLDAATGSLPPGRFRCELHEVEAEFVQSSWASASVRRAQVWSDFGDTTQLFRDISGELPVAVWIGGSFVTTKPDPDDIDLTFLLDGDVYDALSGNSKKKVASLVRRDGPQQCHLRNKTGLLVDVFQVTLRRVAMPWRLADLSNDEIDYFRFRGMWDDWWQRARIGDEEAMPTVEGATAVRGYLEVLL